MSGWEGFLYFESGELFEGEGFGAPLPRGGEAIFNTGMAGYQEIFSDPSYCGQIVVMGSSHIGNTGVNETDIESGGLRLSGVVVREYTSRPSSWRATSSLDDYLLKAKVPAIAGVDTRAITQLIRDRGAQRAVLFPRKSIGKTGVMEYAKALIAEIPSMEGQELVSSVSCREPWVFNPEGSHSSGEIVVFDFGVKWNILRHLAQRNFKVRVLPYNFPASEVVKMQPAAVVLSNGPGDPACVRESVQEISGLMGKFPLLAICMGHQLLARALGAKTFKLKFGHHGVNHPVKDLLTNRILITSQNHGFCVNEEDLKSKDCLVSHRNLNDNTLEGFYSQKMRILSVQFHPEAAPGPSDANYLFDQFIRGFAQ